MLLFLHVGAFLLRFSALFLRLEAFLIPFSPCRGLKIFSLCVGRFAPFSPWRGPFCYLFLRMGPYFGLALPPPLPLQKVLRVSKGGGGYISCTLSMTLANYRHCFFASIVLVREASGYPTTDARTRCWLLALSLL